MELLHSCATSSDRVSQEDLATQLQALENEFKVVVMGELMCADPDARKQYWLSILADPSKLENVANEVVAKTARSRMIVPQATQQSQAGVEKAAAAAPADAESPAPAAPVTVAMQTLLHVRNTWTAGSDGNATGPLILGFMMALENFIHQGVHGVQAMGAQPIFKQEAGQS